MPRTARCRGPALIFSLLLAGAIPASAQLTSEEFVTGAGANAWQSWRSAIRAVMTRDRAAAETAFGELKTQNPSPLRLALLAERTTQSGENAGALILLEEDAAAGALQPSAREVVERLTQGREQLAEIDDAIYFASIGRFDVADANLKALLAAQPDPVALLEFIDRDPHRSQVLVQVSDNPMVGESARAVLRLLARGETAIKADPLRIRQQIERLGGAPRGYENALSALRESGEYAVPFLIQTLRDPAHKDLVPAIVRALPQLGRTALNPLVMALRVPDSATRKYVIAALGRIGYFQAVPYLMQVRDSDSTPPDVRSAADAALQELAAGGAATGGDRTVADAFFALAQAYYRGEQSLAADPRLDTANVWYWRDDLLQNVEAPAAIFDEIMAMRCCEEALLATPDHAGGLALWLAADFRREAQLPEGGADPTRPGNYPSALYFAQYAGPQYCLMTLSRAVANSEAAVALGAIEALRRTAGPASLTGVDGGRQPLAEALSFPERIVRIRAALALATALPQQDFHNSQILMPVLGEALALFGGSRNALVVDSDEAAANAVAAGLRASGYNVVTDSSLLAGLEKSRAQNGGLDLLVLPSDAGGNLSSALAQVRDETRLATTPIVIVTKPGDRESVQELLSSSPKLGQISAGAAPEQLQAVIERVSRASGATPISAQVGGSIALEAAQALEMLALTRNRLFEPGLIQDALVAALHSSDAALRQAAARVLGYVENPAAQEAIASVALDANEAAEMRVAMFAALAEAAKRTGNRLSKETVQDLIAAVEKENNDLLRTAASQAMGALNLPGHSASTMVRNQYGG